MDQRPEQIEQHIRHQRSELEDNFSELEEKVKGAFDWKTQFEERPGLMLGAAFVGEFCLRRFCLALRASRSELRHAVDRLRILTAAANQRFPPAMTVLPRTRRGRPQKPGTT